MTNEKALERPIEPSDPERAGWSDETRDYVEYLEGVENHALIAERDAYRARAERLGAALNVYGNKVEEYASDCPAISDDAYDWLNGDAGKLSRAALSQTNAKPGPTLAEAYRAGLEAAAETCDVVTMDGVGDIIRGKGDEIRALPVPTEFGGE